MADIVRGEFQREENIGEARKDEGYVSVVAGSAKPLGIPEEIAQRCSPVSRASSPSRDDIPAFAGRVVSLFRYPFRVSEDVSGNILNRALRATIPTRDDVVTRQGIRGLVKLAAAALRDSKSPANSKPFKSPEVSPSHFTYVHT